MAEGLGTYAGSYDNGRYVGIQVPSGEVVRVPRVTGFSFIDSPRRQAPKDQGDTLVVDRKRPSFEPRPEVKAWMVDDALREGDIPPELIPAALTGMQAFLSGLADNPDIILTPSRPVDGMWHRFMTRPGDFWRACDEAGAFIDHIPNGPNGSRPPGALDAAQTYRFLENSGYNPDPLAWPAGEEGGDCGGQKCYGGDCTSGGPPGFRALQIISGFVELRQ